MGMRGIETRMRGVDEEVWERLKASVEGELHDARRRFGVEGWGLRGKRVDGEALAAVSGSGGVGKRDRRAGPKLPEGWRHYRGYRPRTATEYRSKCVVGSGRLR